MDSVLRHLTFSFAPIPSLVWPLQGQARDLCSCKVLSGTFRARLRQQREQELTDVAVQRVSPPLPSPSLQSEEAAFQQC